MNMHTSFEARLSRHYAGVRDRLMHPPVKESAPVAFLEAVEHVPTAADKPRSYDYHVHLWDLWRIRMAMPCKSYIRMRCKELGVSYEQIMGACKDTKVFKTRDRLIFEIKTHVQPGISYVKLARLFGKDHSSMILAYNRYLAQHGDAEAADRVRRKREDSRMGHITRKARAKAA